MSLLSVENLLLRLLEGEKPYLLQDVSFTLEAGETVALVGESGSGKSLTALSILRLLPPNMRLEGSIRYQDIVHLSGLSETKLSVFRGVEIGMVFQEPLTALNPLHPVLEQVAEPLLIHGIASRKQALSEAKKLLERVGLRAHSFKEAVYPHQLSGGERQRVLIAMAIAAKPKLLIADEPTTALDVTLQQQILTLLQQLQREEGMGLLLISHDLALVRRVAHKVAVLRQGKLVEVASTAQLFANPQHPYTQMLLAAKPTGVPMPVPPGSEVRLEAQQVSVSFPLGKNFWGKPKEFFHAVQPLSFTLQAGESLGIAGESGSGKTSLALALLRLLPAEGRIIWLGTHVEGLKNHALQALRRHVQLLFQDPFSSLSPRMTVQALVEEGLALHFPDLSPEEREMRVRQSLQEVEMDESFLQRYPHELSGGQRQRVGLARALVLAPAVLVLDEPSSALDRSLQVQLVNLLRRLQQEKGLSYICISHDLAILRALSHRLLIMHKGKKIEEGSVASIFAKPSHAYTRALLQAAFPEENFTTGLVKKATTTEALGECLAIRRHVFIEEQNVPEARELDGKEDEATHYLFYEDDLPIGTARARKVKEGIKLERVALLPEHRGQGEGTEFMQALLLVLEQEFGPLPVLLGAQLPVVSLYEKCGFHAFGPVYMDAGIPHRDMRRESVKEMAIAEG